METRERSTLSLHDALPIFARLPVRLQEEHAEHVHEREADQQVRRPAVDVADQPSEAHLRHDELHALIRFRRDRKCTRLNSSHMSISYAVFCLKKKNQFIQK